MKVQPHRQYHLSVRIRAQDFRGTPEVKVLAGGKPLNYNALGVEPTQDWKTHHAVFNSLEHEEVAVYLGCWDGQTGSVWYDDAALEEVGLLNVLRRPGAPLLVRWEHADSVALAEGVDFEPVADPRMGNQPWKGEFEVWHEPPPLRLTQVGRREYADGTRLRVSYYHPLTIYTGSVMICPSEPRTLELLRDQAARVHAAFGARRYFMGHDEIRVLNHCAACRARGLDAGQILAENVRACTRILREINPEGRIYVWSDMFDPNHNARRDYYLVRGDLAGSWEGLEPEVTPALWHFDQRRESLAWFKGRGHRVLIAGYYDADPARVAEWIEAADEAGGTEAVMYTTWRGAYEDLEAFAAAVLDRAAPAK